MPEFKMPALPTNKYVASVYKITFDNSWFYIGSSVNTRRRWLCWKHALTHKKPKNENMRLHLPNTKEITFEILERVDNEFTTQEREAVYLTENIDDILCMNQCPDPTTAKNRRSEAGFKL